MPFSTTTRFPRDPNFQPAIGAMLNDGTDQVYPLLMDSVTHRLLVDSSGGGGSSGTQYAEDSASVSGDLGNLLLAIRKDTPATLSSTDGDYEGLQISSGLLWVRPKGFLTPNGDSMIDDTLDGLNAKLVGGSAGITDGTNSTNILKSDGTAAGQNSLLVAGAYMEKAGLSTASTTNNDLLTSTDVSGYKVGSIQILGTWTGTITIQGSNDNTNFSTVNQYSIGDASAQPATTITANRFAYFPIFFRYVRIRVTTGGTGTVTGVAEFYAQVPPQFVIGVGGTVTATGNRSNNATVPASMFGVLPAVANAAQVSYSEGNMVMASSDLKGNIRMRLADAAGNDRGANVNASNQLSVFLPNDQGKTLLSKAGQVSSSGNNTIVTAGTNRLKVCAFSLTVVSTTAVTIKFQDGASGTTLWQVTIQTPASVSSGANLTIQPPAWLFATSAATLLNLNLSTGVAVDYSVTYWDEA